MRVERICKDEHEYDGKKRKPGDKVEVEPGHILVLLMQGYIEAEPGEMGYVPKEQAGAPVRARRNGSRRL